MDDSKVAVLLEDLRAQFRVFGEGLQMVIQDVSDLKQDVSGLKQDVSGLKQEVSGLKNRFDRFEGQNRREHHQMMQMIQELRDDFQFKLKRAK